MSPTSRPQRDPGRHYRLDRPLPQAGRTILPAAGAHLPADGGRIAEGSAQTFLPQMNHFCD
jgi:hypothetical protein